MNALNKKLTEEMGASNKKLTEEMGTLNKKLTEEMGALNKKLPEEMGALKKSIELNQKQMQDHLKNQEEIISSMIKKYEENFLKEKTKLTADIEELKNQQDVLKISFSFNEKQLLQKMQATINNDIKRAVKGKEKEVLMKFWIQDLKEIVNDFEKMKKMHPKEFNLQLNEIANTIQVFKQKLSL
jgi:vacuolar-type H+-ATPase catalytic subunit A/Vma1